MLRVFNGKRVGAALISLALVLPASAASADGRSTSPLKVIPSGPIYLNATTAPRLSPFASTPKPVVSEGAKAGLIAGGIVAAVLLITGGVIIVNR